MMGFLRGTQFNLQRGWCEIVGESDWSGDCILVDFIKIVLKISRKSMYQGLQEQKGRSESMDCGALNHPPTLAHFGKL